MTFDDQNIVVTGGAGALGSAVVRLLAERGARCHVPCMSGEDEEAAARMGGTIEAGVVGDIGEPDACAGYFARFGPDIPLAASIHIAGGFAMGSIVETDPDLFTRMMHLNATTCYMCCREAVRAMDRAGLGGRIVNVAARPALTPETGAGMVAYTSSKAAVAALTQALGAEVAERGILVNAVAPSILNTPANREAMPDADHALWPEPSHVAETIAFLASSSNTTTRGGIIPVYGKS